ncbi:MAG: RNA-binding S4 domain-containing protein [Paludibacteraceae bacterium]|nr:RNA-binding S4 domain-containing protein [Paludibacteraceae bacterium]
MKEELKEVRIDKWLWAVRLFKTRSLAADACKKGRIARNGTNLKPSHNIRVGDVVMVKRPPVTYSFKVLALSENRMGAKLVPEFMENVTPAEQFEILEMAKFSMNGKRDRGTGRPTKRERRQLMDYMGDDETPDAPSVSDEDLPGFIFGYDSDDDDDEED